MIINLMKKSSVLLILTIAILLAGCQVNTQDYSEISQIINPEIFEYLLEEINFQTTYLINDLQSFIQLYQFKNLSKFDKSLNCRLI